MNKIVLFLYVTVRAGFRKFVQRDGKLIAEFSERLNTLSGNGLIKPYECFETID